MTSKRTEHWHANPLVDLFYTRIPLLINPDSVDFWGRYVATQGDYFYLLIMLGMGQVKPYRYTKTHFTCSFTRAHELRQFPLAVPGMNSKGSTGHLGKVT